ncbi:STAS domain-containing protein [Thalassotalea hakodatensis]|uniref:STAS domain-containing protein n=1 Tax=Thalassotalea hakodatensis TaxID=3030492 RepID=UPI0025746AA5|nr:STAS domain-containing protein [Thalassotalea hakodatensis]
MTTVKITQKRNDSTEIIISGELTIYSVMDIYQEYFKALKFKSLVVLKLAKIEEIDTAGMQLILSLVKTTIEEGKNFQISSTSSAIQDFCQLFNLSILLNTDVQSSLGAI